MDIARLGRTILRKGRFAVPAVAAALLLLPVATQAAMLGDEDSYFYPLLGKYTRTDKGEGVNVKETGDKYGLGLFFRIPVSTRMEGSPNVEADTESDRRFIANVRLEASYVSGSLSATADNAAALGNNTYNRITASTATAKTQHRIFYGEGDLGYRIRLGQDTSVEPFAGIGLTYGARDVDSGDGITGYGSYDKILAGRVGVRAERSLGPEMSLSGELGAGFPLYVRVKENLGPSVTFSPGLASGNLTVAFRYAQYRVIGFYERATLASSTNGSGMVRPESKEETLGLRLGIGY
jgi:hypothetical protein